MRKILIPIILVLSLQSCNIVESYICKEGNSDSEVFRAKSNAISTDSNLAKEKALFNAKADIAEEIDAYILDKYSYQTFLADPEFEAKLNTARKNMLNEISIVCSKTIPKKDMYKSFVSIEISRQSIDDELERRLNEETQ